MKFRPLHDRVLVKRAESEKRSPGGLIIPTIAQEKAQEADVVAVGNGKVLEDGRTVPVGVQPGDRIIFGKYSGGEVLGVLA